MTKFIFDFLKFLYRIMLAPGRNISTLSGPGRIHFASVSPAIRNFKIQWGSYFFSN
jgi:hypothetical protein